VIFTFGNQHPIEAYIIYNHAVRQAFDAEGHEIIMPISLYFQPGRNALAGNDSDFQRRVANRSFDKISCLFIALKRERPERADLKEVAASDTVAGGNRASASNFKHDVMRLRNVARLSFERKIFLFARVV
jgi:hypothetical protein